MRITLFLGIAAIVAACAPGTGEPAAPEAREAETAAENPPAPLAPPATTTAIPTSPDALKSWLLEGRYKAWAHETAPHPSTGPHASSVLTFVSSELEGSLARATAHPAGAAAVKEFLGPSGVTGWAVAVKTQASSQSGAGWYWYETFSTQPGKHGIEGQGEAICVNCHDGGSDFVLTPYPLR